MKLLKIIRRLSVYSAFMMAINFTSCGDEGPVAPEPESKQENYVAADSTKIIPQEEENTVLKYDAATGSMELDETSDYAKDITKGTILIGQDDETAPAGFLRKVTSVNNVDDRLVLDTEPALLTEAFEQMAISDSVRLRPSQVKSMKLMQGVTYYQDAEDDSFRVNIDRVFADEDGDTLTKNDQVRLVGYYSFTADLLVDIDIPWRTFTLEKLEVVLKTGQKVNLDLVANVEWDFESEKSFELWETRLGVIPVGGPVYIVPTLSVEAHIHGDMSVTIETGMIYTQVIRNGFGYDKDATPKYYTISKSEKDFVYDPPNLRQEFNFEAGASLNVSCLVYGFAGPYVAGKTGFQFESLLSSDPCSADLTFDLEAILYATVGVEMDAYVFDLDWSPPDFEIYRYSIGSWDFPLGGSGNVIVDPNPDDINAPWSIEGPCGYSNSGNGDETLPSLDPGDYTITWGEVSGYIIPSSNLQTLNPDETITFSGTYVEDSVPPEGFVLIPAGTFTMGSPTDEPGRGSDETQHTVTLTHDFYLSATQVTNQQYVDMVQWAYDNGYCTATTSSVKDAYGSTVELLDLDDHDCEISFSSSNDKFNVDSGREQHPVKEVNWYGATAYCDWLSIREGLIPAYDHSTWECNNRDPYNASGYRLPTEAEWEYACRAGTQTPFNTGSCLDAGTEANYNGNHPYSGCPSGDYIGDTVPVGSYPPNNYDLFDMHGNTYDWCNDWYGEYNGNEINPIGPHTGTERVRRGGFPDSNANDCRSAHRYWRVPDGEGSCFRICRIALIH